MLRHHNQPHMLPLSPIGHCAKEWRKKESFSVSSCIFNGEKRPTQKIKNQQSITPFALKTFWTLSKTSKKLTSAVDAKGKKKKAKKGEYLVQTFQGERFAYLWLASW